MGLRLRQEPLSTSGQSGGMGNVDLEDGKLNQSGKPGLLVYVDFSDFVFHEPFTSTAEYYVRSKYNWKDPQKPSYHLYIRHLNKKN